MTNIKEYFYTSIKAPKFAVNLKCSTYLYLLLGGHKSDSGNKIFVQKYKYLISSILPKKSNSSSSNPLKIVYYVIDLYKYRLDTKNTSFLSYIRIIITKKQKIINISTPREF